MYIHSIVFRVQFQFVLYTLHISVGFCVARSTTIGQCEGLGRGTGDWYRFPRFFFFTACRTTRSGEFTRNFKNYRVTFGLKRLKMSNTKVQFECEMLIFDNSTKLNLFI